MTDQAKRFSPHTLDHFADLVLGDPRHEDWHGPQPYRSGPKIERWVRHFVPGFALGGDSRYQGTRNQLEELNETDEGRETLRAMMAAVLDPRDYAQSSALLDEDIEKFNNVLWYDGYRLVREPRSIRLEQITETPVLADCLEDTLVELDWSTVVQEFRRMVDNSESDPEDAITAACSLVESVCRSILVELQVEMPSKRAITTLYRAVAKELNLASDREDFPPDVAEDSRRILGGLASAVDGLGHLRTKTGDAHGREHTVRRVDPRVARLAIGSAATLSQFLIESWQRQAAISRVSE